jgi:hypothetical protein
MNELMTEALTKLQCFIKSGLRGFAQQAFDRLRALGMSEQALGRVEQWDEAHARKLYHYLTQK